MTLLSFCAVSFGPKLVLSTLLNLSLAEACKGTFEHWGAVERLYTKESFMIRFAFGEEYMPKNHHENL